MNFLRFLRALIPDFHPLRAEGSLSHGALATLGSFRLKYMSPFCIALVHDEVELFIGRFISCACILWVCVASVQSLSPSSGSKALIYCGEQGSP